MNERRARHLLPRPWGLKPHPFTPPLLPPTPRVIPANPATQRGRPHSRHSCAGRNPEGLCPGGVTLPPTPAASPTSLLPVVPAKSATQRGRPHASSFLRKQESRGAVPRRGNPATNTCRFPDFPPSRRSCEVSNPEGSSPRIVIPAKAGIQRGCARVGLPHTNPRHIPDSPKRTAATIPESPAPRERAPQSPRPFTRRPAPSPLARPGRRRIDRGLAHANQVDEGEGRKQGQQLKRGTCSEGG